MKKLFTTLLAGCMMLAGCALTAQEVFRNPKFATLEERTFKDQKFQFPKSVYVPGDFYSKVEMIKGENGNVMHLKGAALDLSIIIPKDQPEGSLYKFTVRAKGKGKLHAKYFTKEGKWEGNTFKQTGGREKDLPAQNLTEEYQDYTFTVPYIAQEGHFAFIPGGSDCYIESTTGTVIPPKGK